MKIFVVRHRTFLAIAVCIVIGVGGMTLAQHSGKGQVKVTQLSQRDIIEKLDGKDASATQISVEDALKASGADAVYYGTQMRGVSNAKAKRELNFQSRPLEWIVDTAVAHAS